MSSYPDHIYRDIPEPRLDPPMDWSEPEPEEDEFDRLERIERAAPDLLAAIDHPLLRKVFSEIEDSRTPEAARLWAWCQLWFDVRDRALAKATLGAP